MATIWDNIKYAAGNAIDTIGSSFGNPLGQTSWLNKGVDYSSKLMGVKPVYAADNNNWTGSYGVQPKPPTQPSPLTSGGGSIPSVGTGGGGSGQVLGINDAPMEQAPGQPSIDYNAIFAPAFDALSQQEAASRGSFDADLAGMESETGQRITGLENEQASRMANFGQQRGEAQGQTDSVVEQARRQASELLQGIQSRYGGTTGTGRFSSEILGSQATRNIATNQAALQNTLGKIGQAENNLKTEVTTLINNAKESLATDKLKLRAQLDQNLAEIGKERGRLESEKAQRRVDALMQYQSVLSGIEQRNTQFQQQLFMQSQQAQAEIDKLKSRAQQSYQVNLTPSNINSFVQSGMMSPQQAQGLLGALGYLPKAQGLPMGANVTGKSFDELTGQVGQTSFQQEPDNALLGALGY